MRSAGCQGCKSGAEKFDLAMAFQPIVDVTTGRPFAYEALVRGENGESAATVLAQVTPASRYAFDQQCRVAAIKQAVEAGILTTNARLSINFLPNAVYSPVACIQLTLKTARATGMPTERLIFEFTESEKMADTDHVADIIASYQRMGFLTALDDFGAGYSSLGLLARMKTDLIKLDMELVRGINTSLPRRMIVESSIRLMERLGITVIAEGIETEEEYATLVDLGVRYQQGFLFAKPGFRSLPAVCMPTVQRRKIA